MAAVKASLEANIEHYHFREALKDAMNIARIGNKYLADTEPWKVIKSDPQTGGDDSQYRPADHGEYGHCHRTFHALLGREDTRRCFPWRNSDGSGWERWI